MPGLPLAGSSWPILTEILSPGSPLWLTGFRHTGTTFLARSISLSLSCQNLTLLYVPGMHSIQQAGGPLDYELM